MYISLNAILGKLSSRQRVVGQRLFSLEMCGVPQVVCQGQHNALFAHLLFIVDFSYRVALNFCGSLILRIGAFLCFAGANFCDWKRLVFLAGN